MNITKIIGIILIIASIGLGYVGVNKISDSTKDVSVLGIEFKASDESGKTQGYIYVGLAIVLFIGGVASLRKKNS